MQIIERAGTRVVGIQIEAHWKRLWTDVPKGWQRLFARAGEIEGRVAETFVDVSLEERDGLYTQLVGAEVRGDGAVPEGMVRVDVPARRYVHLRHVGTVSGIAESFGRMLAWADAKGLQTDAFKIDSGYTPAGDETAHDLYVRLRQDERTR